MDYKVILALISTILGLICFIPYFRDIFQRKTKPHAYTWFIWTITQGTAVAGIFHGGGGIGALGFVFGTLSGFAVFLISLKYGTKNITKIDTAVLVVALFAIFVWWKLHDPVAAVILISAIDGLGYLPSIRKSFHEPWSETVITWIGFIIANTIALLALREYNLLTVCYIITITIANALLAFMCIVRRPFVPRPKITN